MIQELERYPTSQSNIFWNMIRSIEELAPGIYIADFRGDEGIRIREEFICPSLTTHSGGGVRHERLLIEVVGDENSTDTD